MAADSGQRRLAAILSLDAAGYSRLMADDDAATVRTISAYRDSIRLLVEQHGGRVVDDPGDNLLAELPSAAAAVTCAAEIQRVVRARNEPLPPERRMQFRIGVHLGDVLVDGDRLYGDGVNVAARLEELAPTAGICISEDVHRQVEARVDLEFEDLGERTLKNIPRPVRVYRVAFESAPAAPRRRSRLRAATVAGGALVAVVVASLALSWPAPLGLLLDWTGAGAPPVNPPLPDRPSLVVLPFQNLSDDPEQEYFADGFTDDLTTNLSTTPEVFVISRTSAFSYKGRELPIVDIARELGVRYALEGSVRREGGELRINAQLIDAASDFHVWAQRYERPPDEALALGSEIAGEVLAALKVKLREEAIDRASRRSTSDPAAYDAWLRGYTAFQRFTRMGNLEARRWCERATELDPEFGEAWSMAATTYVIEYSFGWNLDRSLLELARERVDRALAIDPESASAHGALSQVHLYRGRTQEAIEAARRAVEQAPNLDTPYLMLSLALSSEGRFLAAMQALQQALRLNPKASSATLMAAGFMNLGVGRPEEAVALWERVRAANPDLIIARLALAVAYADAGRDSEAAGAIREALRINPALSIEAVQAWEVIGGDLYEVEMLRRAGLPETGRGADSRPGDPREG